MGGRAWCANLKSINGQITRLLTQGANYISFQGPEKELPQGDTTYGTSITRYKGMDDGNDIIVRDPVPTRPSASGRCRLLSSIATRRPYVPVTLSVL
jgi:hypothetical protein